MGARTGSSKPQPSLFERIENDSGRGQKGAASERRKRDRLRKDKYKDKGDKDKDTGKKGSAGASPLTTKNALAARLNGGSPASTPTGPSARVEKRQVSGSATKGIRGNPLFQHIVGLAPAEKAPSTPAAGDVARTDKKTKRLHRIGSNGDSSTGSATGSRTKTARIGSSTGHSAGHSSGHSGSSRRSNGSAEGSAVPTGPRAQQAPHSQRWRGRADLRSQKQKLRNDATEQLIQRQRNFSIKYAGLPPIVHISNLDLGTSSSDVRAVLEDIGVITDCRTTEVARSVSAEVVFADPQHAELAVSQLHGSFADGRQLTATIARTHRIPPEISIQRPVRQ